MPAVLCLLAFCMVVYATPKDVRLRNQCLDGTMSIFIRASTVPLNTLSEKLPIVDYEANTVHFEDKEARGKITWEPLPKGARVNVECIAERKGREIYRATYEWDDQGGHSRCLLLACRDYDGAAEGWSVRPFFIAGDEQLSDVESRIVSTSAYPFTVDARISWKGNGVAWHNYTFLFDNQGPYLFESASGGRRLNAEYRRYRGNKVIKKWRPTEN